MRGVLRSLRSTLTHLKHRHQTCIGNSREFLLIPSFSGVCFLFCFTCHAGSRIKTVRPVRSYSIPLVTRAYVLAPRGVQSATDCSKLGCFRGYCIILLSSVVELAVCCFGSESGQFGDHRSGASTSRNMMKRVEGSSLTSDNS